MGVTSAQGAPGAKPTSVRSYIHPSAQLRDDMLRAEHPRSIPTLIPFSWYFAASAFGYLNIAAEMKRIGYGELEALAEVEGKERGKERDDLFDQVIKALNQHNSTTAEITKAFPLCRSFFGTDSLKLVLEAAPGGFTSDELEQKGARDKSGYEYVRHLRYPAGFVELDAMKTAMELAVGKSEDAGSQVTLHDTARAAIPFVIAQSKNLEEAFQNFEDAELNYIFQNFYVNFSIGGLNWLLGKDAGVAMLVTSPFSKGKVYVGFPENDPGRNKEDRFGFAHYRHFVEMDWSDYDLMRQVMHAQAVAQLLGTQQMHFPANRLVTGNDPSAVGTLEFALVSSDISLETYAGIISESRSLAYQQPDGFRPSEAIQPVTRWLKMNELYSALEPVLKERVQLVSELRQKVGV